MINIRYSDSKMNSVEATVWLSDLPAETVAALGYTDLSQVCDTMLDVIGSWECEYVSSDECVIQAFDFTVLSMDGSKEVLLSDENVNIDPICDEIADKWHSELVVDALATAADSLYDSIKESGF